MESVRNVIFFRILILLQIYILTPALLTGCVSHSQSSFEQAQLNYAQRNYSRSFQDLLIPVQHNDPKALYAMGYMYYYGIGTEKDQDLGRSLIRRSASLNYSPAITALKLITQRRFNQYVPFENYSSAQSEGIWEIKQPIIRGNKS